MAKIKFGQLISEASGKVAGIVFSKNKYGAYTRQKVSPINPQTTAQSRVRQFLASAAGAWKSLTEAQRLQWSSAVQEWKKTNIFGDAQVLSGFNLFCKCYKTAKDISETVLSNYAGSAAPAGITSVSAEFDVTPDAAAITFAPAIPSGEKWLLFATAPVSLGKTFVKSEYRLIKVLASTDTSPYDAVADYKAIFGTIPLATQTAFFKLVPVLKASMKSGISLSAKASWAS